MRQLTDTIRRDIDSGLYDGAVVMVARDGIVACCEALGYADRDAGRAMREDDIFAIFSIAKAMSSMTALQGIERGFYALRTPVAELVPEFAAEGKDKVTVGHLLTRSPDCSRCRQQPRATFPWWSRPHAARPRAHRPVNG